MGLPGPLAYRSILAGNLPMEVPDFRDKVQRERFRGDNACTNPAIAGDHALPLCSHGSPEIPDSVYEEVRREWQGRSRPS
jgi:hypothetical protein